MSYITDLEDVIEEVSDWAVGVIDEIVSRLTLNGPGFEMMELPMEARLEEYGKLRGNVQNWYTFMDDIARGIIEDLLNAGVPEDQISGIHPYNIAFRIAAQHSLDMEKEINNGRTLAS